MQSGFCSFSRLEMASKTIKPLIFKSAKKIKNEEVSFLETASTKNILVSRQDRKFLKKSKFISFKKSLSHSANEQKIVVSAFFLAINEFFHILHWYPFVALLKGRY